MPSDWFLGHSISNGIGTARGHNDLASPYNRFHDVFGTSQPPSSASFPQLPPFIKPLPCWTGFDQVMYLLKQEALSIPHLPLRNALLQCFAEFVHPYMPLIDLHDLFEAVDRNDGSKPISLLTFQASMFSGLATVEMELLKAAGYTTRRDARRDFFQRTRVCMPILKIPYDQSLIMLQLLHDFDCEVDRISLIQSLLLMTDWYEAPDDLRDSHHWIGIAISLSRTIGLHRNPERSSTPPQTKAELPSKTAAEFVNTSRDNVRYATNEITQIVTTLSKLDLVKLLPTVGITVLLPVIITHLLDINAPDEAVRCASLRGFCQCIQAMSKLRDIHAAADYSAAFVGAAIRNAAIVLPQEAAEVMNTMTVAPLSKLGPHEYHSHFRQQHQQQQHSRGYLTRPLNNVHQESTQHRSDDNLECRLNSFPAWTPLNSGDADMLDMLDMAEFEPDFDALLNLDAAGEAFAFDDANCMIWGGENGAEGSFWPSLPSLVTD